jgi:hypothetical protein
MLDKNRLIGTGKTAEIFEIDPGRVLKLYYPHIGKTLNEYEYEVGQLIKNAGVPSPAVYEHVTIDDRDGLVLEHAGRESMFAAIMQQPWRIRYFARQKARLHAAIHQCHAGSLISQQRVAKNKIALSEELLGDKVHALYSHIAGLPGGTSICHGDFHPQNILKCVNGYLAIDWADVSCGHPAGDVARTCLILASPHIPTGSNLARPLFILLKRMLLIAYLREYTHLTGLKRSEINQWLVPIAAGRIKEEVEDEREWLLSIVEGRRLLRF